MNNNETALVGLVKSALISEKYKPAEKMNSENYREFIKRALLKPFRFSLTAPCRKAQRMLFRNLRLRHSALRQITLKSRMSIS